jgi:hypothetical protein
MYHSPDGVSMIVPCAGPSNRAPLPVENITGLLGSDSQGPASDRARNDVIVLGSFGSVPPSESSR